MAVQWVFLGLALAVLIPVKSDAQPDDDHSRILQELRRTFRDFRTRQQFAVLYMPVPNAPADRVTYPGWHPDIDYRGGIYPSDLDTINNHAAATPDIYNENGDRVHSEETLLTQIFPVMRAWYNRNYNQPPMVIYLFTHYLPCQDCFNIIQTIRRQNRNIQIYVGYIDTFGGAMDNFVSDFVSPTDVMRNQIATVARETALQNYLNNNNGRLFHLVDDNGVCGEQGSSGRSKRAAQQNTCPSSNKGRLFIITMDFASGKAIVEYNNIPAHRFGFIGIYKENAERLEFIWTNETTAGVASFGSYISDGYQVKYYNNYAPGPGRSFFVMESSKWQACGFGWTKMNKLPSNRGTVELMLTVSDGFIEIKYKADRQPICGSSDWIAIQAVGQVQQYWCWQKVTELTPKGCIHDELGSKRKKRSSGSGLRSWQSRSRINSALAKGFRLKYVYTQWGHQYEGAFDNATPYWTPNGCRGTQ